ncbi:hypothetical protein LNO19_07925 [Klebsiella quasipneumoniae subsp. similipneumoniae]|nr:hypothetical protein [Klebsiella quasipneumoniae subsp. similipneumoniae]
MYLARFAEAIYVLHCFNKKDAPDRRTRKTDCQKPFAGYTAGTQES